MKKLTAAQSQKLKRLEAKAANRRVMYLRKIRLQACRGGRRVLRKGHSE